MKFKLEKKYILMGITAFFVVAGGIFLYYFIFHGSNIRRSFSNLYQISVPIVNALVISYLMTPLLNYIEKKWIIKLAQKLKIDVLKHKGKIRAFTIILTTLILVLVIYIIIAMLVSQIVPSIRKIVLNFDTYVYNLTSWVNRIFEDNQHMAYVVQDTIKTYSGEFENWLSNDILPQASELLKTLSLSVISILKVLWNFILGFVISIYLLFNKETLAGQAKKIIYAVFKTNIANHVVKEIRFVNKTFTGFIVGKIIDSIIIGFLCFIGTTLIGTPYAALVSVIVGVTNVIPFFGPYLGAIPCGIFILIVDLNNPLNCVYFAIFILILQQFDGNVLGPKILGESTGLSSFWVIFSITLFGGMWGVAGMVIGVPFFAVLYSVVGRLVNRRLRERNLPTETSLYLKVGSIGNDAEFTEYVAPESGNFNKVFSKKEERDGDAEKKRIHLEDLIKKHYKK